MSFRRQRDDEMRVKARIERMEVQRQSELMPFVMEQRNLKNSYPHQLPQAVKEQRCPAEMARTHRVTYHGVPANAELCERQGF